ncbi:MAG: hypothetical protein ACFFD1_12260, partial [Candidatus Thorarchaeota archaeon]
TFLLFLSGGISIVLLLLEKDVETIKLAFLLQTSISLGFIVAGLLAKRFLSTIFRFIILLIVVAIAGGIGLIALLPAAPQQIAFFYLELYPIICFLLWTFFMPIAAFGFAKGLFYNKIIGSALFLGKPQNDNRAIFSGIFALISLVTAVVGIYMLTNPEMLIKLTGIIAIIFSLLVFLITLGKFFRNDVLNSAISVFFTVSAVPSIILLAFSTDNSTITLFNYALLAFSLIYTAQGQAKRALPTSRMNEEDIRIMLAKEKHDSKKTDDPYFISKTLRFFGSEGIVLIFLGTFLGYMTLQLEVTKDLAQNTTNPINTIFRNLFYNSATGTSLTAGQVYQTISIMFLVLILIIVFVTYIFLPSARSFFTADLYRFTFLPTYDEAKAYFTKIQSGEITMKDVSADVIKTVGGAALSSAKMAGASIINRLLGRGKEKDNEKD